MGRRLIVTAESDLNDPRLIGSPAIGGYGLDAMWSDDVHHALHTVLTGESNGYYEDFGSIAQLAQALTRGMVYDGVYSRHRRRRHGRAARNARGSQLIAFLQNHDQVGNRARGDRLTHLVSSDRLKVGAGLLLTSPFVPLLFQGEEWGASTRFPYFTDHSEPELARAVREGRLREFSAFGFSAEDLLDPQAPETFAQAKLDWNESANAPHSEILDWYRQLIRLRRSVPDLCDDRLERTSAVYDEAARWLVLRRGEALVACNLGESEVTLDSLNPGTRTLVLSSPTPPHTSSLGTTLAPWAFALWRPIERNGFSSAGALH